MRVIDVVADANAEAEVAAEAAATVAREVVTDEGAAVSFQILALKNTLKKYFIKSHFVNMHPIIFAGFHMIEEID
jgi:hypothetical protein